MKKQFNIKNMTMAILYIYILAVLFAQSFCALGHRPQLPIFIGFLLAAAAIVKFLFDKCGSISWKPDTAPLSRQEKLLWIVGVPALSILILGTYYLGYFPGYFSPDSNAQLEQAVSGVYSDWHPVAHTLLFFTLPMKLFHSEEVIVLLQMLYFSAALSYLTITMRKTGCPRSICVLEVLFVLAAPVTGSILLRPWKDCALAIFSMLAMAQYMKVVVSEGEWLKKRKNQIALSIVLALTTLMRHNAILFVLPLLLSALVHAKAARRHVAASAVCFLAILIGVKGIVYPLMHVARPEGRLQESVGICMAIMGNAVVNSTDTLDPDVQDFLYQVSPRENWESYYYLGDYNGVKWQSGTDNDVINEAGLWKILEYTGKTIRTCPSASMMAFLQLTGMVWKIDGDISWHIVPASSPDKTEIRINEDIASYAGKLLTSWNDFCTKGLLKYPFYYIGWMDLLLVVFAAVKARHASQLAPMLHAVPILCYNFGTALLLTGFDWRFFYYSFPIIIPTLSLMLRENAENKQENET